MPSSSGVTHSCTSNSSPLIARRRPSRTPKIHGCKCHKLAAKRYTGFLAGPGSCQRCDFVSVLKNRTAGQSSSEAMPPMWAGLRNVRTGRVPPHVLCLAVYSRTAPMKFVANVGLQTPVTGFLPLAQPTWASAWLGEHPTTPTHPSRVLACKDQVLACPHCLPRAAGRRCACVGMGATFEQGHAREELQLGAHGIPTKSSASKHILRQPSKRALHPLWTAGKCTFTLLVHSPWGAGSRCMCGRLGYKPAYFKI